MNSTLPHLLIFQFAGQDVEFDIADVEVMINATEMGKIFGKRPVDFLRLEQTQRFITAMESAFPAFRSEESALLNAGNALSESEEDTPPSQLVRTEKGKGVDGGVTWMHRLLALKFAAWLSAEFEVWIYQTIEQVLFAHGQRIGEEIREKAKLIDRRDEVRVLLQNNELFQEHQMLEYKLRQIGNRISKHNTSQLQLFRSAS